MFVLSFSDHPTEKFFALKQIVETLRSRVDRIKKDLFFLEEKNTTIDNVRSEWNDAEHKLEGVARAYTSSSNLNAPIWEEDDIENQLLACLRTKGEGGGLKIYTLEDIFEFTPEQIEGKIYYCYIYDYFKKFEAQIILVVYTVYLPPPWVILTCPNGEHCKTTFFNKYAAKGIWQPHKKFATVLRNANQEEQGELRTYECRGWLLKIYKLKLPEQAEDHFQVYLFK